MIPLVVVSETQNLLGSRSCSKNPDLLLVQLPQPPHVPFSSQHRSVHPNYSEVLVKMQIANPCAQSFLTEWV